MTMSGWNPQRTLAESGSFPLRIIFEKLTEYAPQRTPFSALQEVSMNFKRAWLTGDSSESTRTYGPLCAHSGCGPLRSMPMLLILFSKTNA